MHLLMTTYHQDIMTNFSWVHDRSTVFTHFSEQFSKIYTSLFVNRSFHAKEQFRYNIVQKKCLIFSGSDINHIKVENKITTFSLNL